MTDKGPDSIQPQTEIHTDGGAAITGNVTVKGDFIGRDKLIVIGSLRIPLWAVYACATVIAVTAVVLITLSTRTYSILTQPSPTATPFVMSSASYNIAVSPFVAVDSGGKVIHDSPESHDVLEKIVSFLSKDDAATRYLRDVTGQAIAIESLPNDLQIQDMSDVKNIEVLARQVHAQAVVYGWMRQVGDGVWQIRPSFYIAGSNQLVEGNLLGEYEVPTAITYSRQNQSAVRDATTDMDGLVTKMVTWFTGISEYERYDRKHLCQAAWMFQQVASGVDRADADWLNKSCSLTYAAGTSPANPIGDVLSQLFLGDAYLHLAFQSYPDKLAVARFLDLADKSYSAGLAQDKSNPRFDVELAQSAFERARMNQKSYRWNTLDYCVGIDDGRLAESKRLFDSALATVETSKTHGVDSLRLKYVEAISHRGLGRIAALHYLRLRCDPPSSSSADYSDAVTHLQAVITLAGTDHSGVLIRTAMLAHVALSEIEIAHAYSPVVTKAEREPLIAEAIEHVRQAFALTHGNSQTAFVQTTLLDELIRDTRYCDIVRSPKTAGQDFSKVCSKENSNEIKT